MNFEALPFHLPEPGHLAFGKLVDRDVQLFKHLPHGKVLL